MQYVLRPTQQSGGMDPEWYTAVQKQKVASAYFTSKQILPFSFTEL